jgi:hypothetical protein
MRNLVVCCDGTWNSPEQEQGGLPSPTNVVKLYNTLDNVDNDDNEQLKYYHSGVGVEDKLWRKIAGGAFGLGLSQNIMSAYKWLACNYQTGDRIFMFGFSRGAYTVRSLAGMITQCGLLDLTDIPDEDTWNKVEKIYDKAYRHKKDISGENMNFHTGQDYKNGKVFFLGVWDTVGALGIPNDLGVLNLLDKSENYSFHDLSLSKNVEHARHAVAMDEKRACFTPTLWENIANGHDVKQVWFPGVHSDVGGGYLECGLSDGALKWMMDEATAVGLRLCQSMYSQVVPNDKGVIHDSCTGGFKMLKTQPRSVPQISQSNNSLHGSVISRQQAPPIFQAPYRQTTSLVKGKPVKLQIYAREHWNYTGIYLETGCKYRLKACGKWLDKTIQCGPDGSNNGQFQAEKLAQIAGTLLGKLEGIFEKITKNDEVDFIGTRREEQYPWFSLIGAIANGDNPDKDGTPAPHETFLIGKEFKTDNSNEFSPEKSGYLYCFANDAWHFYGNNRGSVTLEITKV